MSGTSLDGVDVALLETDGEAIQRFGPTGYRPYSEAERDLPRRALAAGAHLTDRTVRPGVLAEAEAFVTCVQAETVVVRVVPHLSAPPRTWVVAGGGAHNPTLMRMLAARLVPAPIETADAAGWSAADLCQNHRAPVPMKGGVLWPDHDPQLTRARH